jgi:hypothetical protein
LRGLLRIAWPGEQPSGSPKAEATLKSSIFLEVIFLNHVI